MQWKELQKVAPFLSEELVLISPEEYKPEKRLKVSSMANIEKPVQRFSQISDQSGNLSQSN